MYTLTNSPAGNAVKVFNRAGNGSLSPGGEFATGGTGTGGSLGNQGGLVLDDRYLFAVNAGSDSVSVLKVKRDGLQLVDTAPSGGDQPISVTVDDGLALRAQCRRPGNISGFWFSKRWA